MRIPKKKKPTVKASVKPKIKVKLSSIKIRRVPKFTIIQHETVANVKFIDHKTAPGNPKTTKKEIAKGIVFFTYLEPIKGVYRCTEASSGYSCGYGRTRTEAVSETMANIDAVGLDRFKQLIREKHESYGKFVWKESE